MVQIEKDKSIINHQKQPDIEKSPETKSAFASEDRYQDFIVK